MSPAEQEAPPVGEEIHLPEPSILPILNATGVAMGLVGLTLSWWLTGVGGLLFLVTLVLWIRSAARDLSALPADHSGH